MNPPSPIENLKIQLEIHFLTFLNADQNAPKKIRIVIWTFSFEICFRNQFWTLGSGQTENTQIRVFAYFQFDHFPKSKIDSLKHISNENVHITFLFFFFSVSISIWKSKKMDFPLYFQILIAEGRFIFKR